MATTKTEATAKRVKGGSFLTEERQSQDIFTMEDFTDEHRQIAKTVIEFTTNEVLPVADQIEAKNFDVTRGLLRKAADLGLTAEIFSCHLADTSGYWIIGTAKRWKNRLAAESL